MAGYKVRLMRRILRRIEASLKTARFELAKLQQKPMLVAARSEARQRVVCLERRESRMLDNLEKASLGD